MSHNSNEILDTGAEIGYNLFMEIDIEEIASLTLDIPKLIKARERKGLRPIEAANGIGISRQRLYAFEKGKDRIPGHILIKMCALYEIAWQEIATKNFASEVK